MYRDGRKTIISTKRPTNADVFKEVYTHGSSVVSVRKSPRDGVIVHKNPETHKSSQLNVELIIN